MDLLSSRRVDPGAGPEGARPADAAPPGAADSAISTAGFLALTAALALVVHQAGHDLHFSGAVAFSWLALGFSFQSLLVAALTWGVPRPAREGLRLADLATWSIPLVFFLQRLSGTTVAEIWVALAIFAKLLVGLAAAVVAAGQRAPRLRLAGWSLAGLAIAFYLVPLPVTRMNGIGPLTGDEPHYLIVTQSLLRDHDVFVEDEYAQKTWRAYLPADRLQSHAVPARGGHEASMHEPGLSIAATLPFALGGWLLVLAMIAGLTALLVRELFLLCLQAGLDPPFAVGASAVLGAGLPIGVYATQIFPEALVALGVGVALRQLWGAAVQGRGSALVAGLALAPLPWLHVRSWAISLPLALGALLVWRSTRSRLAAALPLALSGLGYVAFNAAVYGHPALSPVLENQLFTRLGSPTPAGAVIAYARLWLDPNDGLVLVAPALLLALAAIPGVLRAGLAGFVNIAAFLAYTGLVAAYALLVGQGWSSGAGFGLAGRYLVPAMPLLAVPLGLGLQLAFRRSAGLLALGLVAAGTLTSLVSYADRNQMYPAAVGDGPIRVLGRALSLPVAPLLAVFRPETAGSWLRVGVFAAALLGLGLWLNLPWPGRRAAAVGTAPA